jgi:hypothetical protein
VFRPADQRATVETGREDLLALFFSQPRTLILLELTLVGWIAVICVVLSLWGIGTLGASAFDVLFGPAS